MRLKHSLIRAFNWTRAIFRNDVIGARIDDYDRACIRAAEVYDRQDRYIRRLERQS